MNQNGFVDFILPLCDTMSFASDIDTLTNAFVKNVSQVFHAGKVSFMLLDDAKGELGIKASQGLDPSVTQAKVKLGEMFSGKVARDRKPLLVKDVEEEFPDMPRGRLTRYTSKSFMIVPVETREELLGVVSLTDRTQEEAFNEHDVKLLKSLCNYFALHIEMLRLLEHNKNIAILDPLTGLYNHRFFQEQLLEEIYRAERYKHPVSLMMVDIDNFTAYNEAHSYSAGDSVFKQIGKIIRENLRQADVLSRYGLDEFAIILPETKIKEALFVGEKVREKIGFAVFTGDESRKSPFGMARLTASIGIAEHRVGLTKEELIRHASGALMEAQQKGKNCVCVFK